MYDQRVTTRRALITSLPLLPRGFAQDTIYDLLIKNGQVIDPKNGRNGRFDIAVTGGKIARIASGIPAAHARVVMESGSYYVTPGLIDIHAHFDAGGAELNLQPDHHSLPSGVTTAVDAGSTGDRNFEAFKART